MWETSVIGLVEFEFLAAAVAVAPGMRRIRGKLARLGLSSMVAAVWIWIVRWLVPGRGFDHSTRIGGIAHLAIV